MCFVTDWVYAGKIPCEIPKIAYLRYLDGTFLRIDPICLIFLLKYKKLGSQKKLFSYRENLGFVLRCFSSIVPGIKRLQHIQCFLSAQTHRSIYQISIPPYTNVLQNV